MGLSRCANHHFGTHLNSSRLTGFLSTDEFHEEVDTKVSSIPLSDCFASTIRA
jgi:hypothetical protein